MRHLIPGCIVPAMIAIIMIAQSASAQSYVNQKELEKILGECEVQSSDAAAVSYEYFEFYDRRSNPVLAKNTFYKIIGDGDVYLGAERAKLVSLLNRSLMSKVEIGDSLVIPSAYTTDFCSYSPFPRLYAGAQEFDKLFIIDKTLQAWAAYELGVLTRWGIVNT
jgi:hypothetical protein